MGFWGVEVKPKKKVDPFASVSARGRLRITQAILGPGVSSQKAILQCFTDPKHSIYLCVLSPDKTDSCSLDLEFDVEDKVAFSVIGNRSIHLSGYFLTDDGESDGDDCELGCCAEDEADSDSRDLSEEYDSEEEYDDFSEESDYEMLPSPTAKSGVVIEEIVDDEKPAFENGKQEQKGESQGRMVVKSITADPNLGSEDEDGYPLSVLQGKTKETEAVQPTDISMIEETMEGKDEGDHANNRKRDSKSVEQDEKPDKKKKRKKEKGNNKEKNGDTVDGGSKPDEVKKSDGCEVDLVGKEDEKSHDSEPKAEKKNKKKNKKKAEDSASAAATVNKNQPVVDRLDRPSETKPSQVRTFPNGLVIEELAMGEPDGKKAEPGKQVVVRYIGKLQKNGKIFDSNIRQAPFKFRLGIGHVIKGWDVGVNGMRIGDKRRLTIPPSMGYGAKGAGGKIPPNSWLVFDVELVDVR